MLQLPNKASDKFKGYFILSSKESGLHKMSCSKILCHLDYFNLIEGVKLNKQFAQFQQTTKYLKNLECICTQPLLKESHMDSCLKLSRSPVTGCSWLPPSAGVFTLA